MAENKLERTNEFKIVGILKSAEKNERVGKTGQNYVSVDATIESVINGVTKTFEVRFFSSAVTNDNKPSKLYDTYSNLPDLVGKKVELTQGSIRENRYWSTRQEQMVSSYELSGRFVRGVADATADEATFHVSGFIVSALTERKNKADEVYRYDLGIGQSDYAGNNMSKIMTHVNPQDRELIAALDTLEVGQTVELYGDLDFVSQTVNREKQMGFGKPIIETFTNIQKNYYINAGKVLEGETAYTSADVKDLVSSYKARDVELQESAASKTSTSSASVEEKKPAVTHRQSALI